MGDSSNKESTEEAVVLSHDAAETATAQGRNLGLVIAIIAGILGILILIFIFAKKKADSKESEVR